MISATALDLSTQLWGPELNSATYYRVTDEYVEHDRYIPRHSGYVTRYFGYVTRYCGYVQDIVVM